MQSQSQAGYAPVVFIGYNRPKHTQQTLNALAKNHIAAETDLIAYVDGPKNVAKSSSIEQVVSILRAQEGFRSVTINRREQNYGLAKNISESVSDVMSEYGRAIILEDDLVTSPAFLTYMNKALDRYQHEPSVWHISGGSELLGDVDSQLSFLWQRMNCWGWATWEDRWSHFKRDTDYFIENFTPEMINRFNLDGVENQWDQILRNHRKEISTWAVFWGATILINNGYCLNPYQTYVHNIGFDGTGLHCGFNPNRQDVLELNDNVTFQFPDLIQTDEHAVEMAKAFILSNKERPKIKRPLRTKLKKVITELLS